MSLAAIAFFASLAFIRILLSMLSGCSAEDGSGLLVQLSGEESPSRGSVLLMECAGATQQAQVGDNVVISIDGELKRFHFFRKIWTLRAGSIPMTSFEAVTKGSTNAVDDRGLYPRDVKFIKSNSWMYRGKVIAYMPLLGIANVLWWDFPIVCSLLFLSSLWFAIRRNSVILAIVLSICAVVQLCAKQSLGTF